MIAVSCFSAAATCTLSGARVYLAMAQDGVFFKRMAVIHPKWRTPAFSLIGQGIWAAALTLSGRYDQLYTYVIYGMVLSYTLTVIAHVLVALEASRHSATVPLHGISVAACDLRADRHGVDAEYNLHAADRGVLGNGHRAGRRPFLFVLEAQQPESRGAAIADHLSKLAANFRLAAAARRCYSSSSPLTQD